MSCLSWNCRGLGNPHAIHTLQRLIFSQDPTKVFLYETKSNSRHMDHLGFKLKFDHSFTVDSRGNSTRLCVLWKEEINLCLRSYSQNMLIFIWVCQTTQIIGVSQFSMVFWLRLIDINISSYYSLFAIVTPSLSYVYKISTKFSKLMSRKKVMFNKIDRWRGFVMQWRAVGLLILAFLWIILCGLGGIKVRLDRALGNQEWVDMFPQFSVYHLKKSTFNHVSVVLNWSGHKVV